MKYWNSTQLIQFPSGISIERDYSEMLISPVSPEFSGSGLKLTFKVPSLLKTGLVPPVHSDQ